MDQAADPGVLFKITLFYAPVFKLYIFLRRGSHPLIEAIPMTLA